MQRLFHTTAPGELGLGEGQWASFQVKAGEHLRCQSGRLLLTLEGCNLDVELRSGLDWRVPNRGRVVIEAVEASRLQRQAAACGWFRSARN